jgi:CHAT domain-containing protein
MLTNLGAQLHTRYKRSGQVKDLEAAIAHYHAAIAAYGATFPFERRLAANNLGILFYDEQRYLEARQAFEQAHVAIQQLASFEQSEAVRRKMSGENATLYAHLVFCCLYAGDTAAAFAYASAGKGRAFVDLLHSARFDLAAVGADQPELLADIKHARDLRAQIDAILAHLTGESGSARGDARAPTAVLQAELARLYDEQKTHWDAMARNYPVLTATQRAPDLDATAACTLARNLGAVLVEFFQHAQGWCAFVVTAERVQHVALDSLTDHLLRRMLVWTDRITLRSGQGPPSYEQLDSWYQAIIAPLHDHLPPGGRVVLAPQGVLHLLPLAAARNPQSKQYACDAYTLAFAPSLAALHVTQQQARLTASTPAGAANRQRLLSVAYPGAPDSQHRLPNVLPEAKSVARCFTQVEELHEDRATPNAVVAHSAQRDVIHMGCHGYFDPALPDQSGLLLAGGWLTVQRIITDLKLQQTHLFTMGACVSGRVDLNAGDELVGLSQAALTAGARVVVASQWPVHDAATRALFTLFYAHVAAGHAPAQAMQVASTAVRQRPGWAHPYYWSAFLVNGLAYQAAAKVSAVAPTITHQVDDIYQHRAITRGSMSMRISDIIKEAYTLLDHLISTQSGQQSIEALSEWDEEKRQIVIAALRSLPEQVEQLASDADLLALAKDIISLIEATPPLCQGLLPEATAQLMAEERHQRDVILDTLLADDNSAHQHEYLRRHRPGFIDMTMQLRQQLDAAIPPTTTSLEELPPADQSGRARESWWQRILKQVTQ